MNGGCMPLASVELKELTDKAENIYEAVVIMSKRARQINEELKIRLNQELEMFTQHVE
ncbi:MAG: DNA-directed RNA polymerase subunit omega, partial [Chlorobi bacterium]|nr:DNA-directed RNA polymerase subunit omega [Chlorobiota bacterium]